MHLKRYIRFMYTCNSLICSFLCHFRLLYLVETGIVKYKLGVNLTDAIICPLNLGAKERQLRNSDLSMTYWLMVIGFSLSITIFFSEVNRDCSTIHFKTSILHWNRTLQFIFKIIFRRWNANQDTIKLRNHQVGKGRDNTKVLMKNQSNITPPPAYATLFNRSKMFTTDDFMKSRESNAVGKTQVINGRDYMVFHTEDGHTRLIPIRTPSATLFQYTYTK